MSTGLRAGTNNDGYLQVNGTDVLTALSSGRIGIGTTGPARKVEIVDTAATVLQLNSTSSDGTSLRILHSGNDKMYMGLAGDFIIGQANNVTDSAIRSNGSLLFASGGGTERLCITSTGNVGIGTTNPGGKLEVYSGTNTQSANTGGDNIIVKDSDGAGISIFSGDGNSQNIYLGSSSSNNNVRFEGFYNGGSPYFKIHVAGSEAYQVDNNLNVLPGADATQDFGSPTKRWANIYSADLQLSNEGSQNDVDGTWGIYTIQEGEDDLFLLNRRNGKKYKFVLQEVN